jgi:nicotinate-nucleotide pyrophosphorylase (carboxylating)
MTRVDEAQALHAAFDGVIAVALQEDLGEGEFEADVTTEAIVDDSLRGNAVVLAKQTGVICGLDALRAAFAQLDDRVSVTLKARDGNDVSPGDVVATVDGPVRAILTGERTALNLIGHLSGIATLVRSFVVRAPGVTFTDTRKTFPGLRLLQKYAVRVGGGSNHRFALWDGVLIKDNHIVAAGSVGEAVRLARASTALPVQAECTTLAEVNEALDAGAPAILLDNQGPAQLRELTAHIKARAKHVMVEASGGVTLTNAADIAATGVDRISVGAFTHSAPALDVSLDLIHTGEADR